MSTSFLPSKDADLIAWEANFQNLIALNPTLYGLTSADATAITASYTAFDTAYNTAINPSTRTTVTVNAKNLARNSSIAVMRAYAALIRTNTGVSDANKIAVGVPPRDPSNTPVPPPATNPIITATSGTSLQLACTYHDVLTPSKKGKPAGVSQLELHVLASLTAPTGPDATPYYGMFTRTPFTLNFQTGDGGKTAWIYGRWMNDKGQTGPWSPLASMTIMA